MNRFRSLALLGFGPALIAPASQAADLPLAPPIDYVRVCDAFGSGFYYIPGSETCIRVFGRMRADYRYLGRTPDSTSEGWRFRARAYLRVDTRTSTEYGLLRTFFDIWIHNDYSSGKGRGWPQPWDPGGSSSSTGVVTLDRAFIQFGGLTAGMAQSFFDFYYTPTYQSAFEPSHSDSESPLLAYTFGFGNGVSASIALEANITRFTGAAASPAVPVPAGVTNVESGLGWPDVVANIRVDQAWGSAQIMGALHNDRTVTGGGISKVGWAVGAGATVTVPFNGFKDEFGIQAAYSRGAIAYTYYSTDATANDFFVVAPGVMRQSTAWSAAAGYLHHWSSRWSSGIGVSVLDVDQPVGGPADFRQYDAQANLVYRPVNGLQFGAEFEYRRSEIKGASNINAWEALFRIQRDF